MKYTVLFLLLVLVLSCSSSSNNEETDPELDCGCEAENWRQLPSDVDIYGRLFKMSNDPEGDYPIWNNNKYWIVVTSENCSNCVGSLIICNEEILEDFENIPELSDIRVHIDPVQIQDGILVNFTGEITQVCNSFVSYADYTYDNISVNQISIR